MQQPLKQHITSRLGEDVPHLEKVLGYFKERQVKRNELLLQQGEVCRSVYYVVQGCLQVFVDDEDMNETTRDLIVEGNWCSELMSFGKGVPALENIRAVEHTTLMEISKEGFDVLIQTVPQFDKVYKQILEASYANAVYRINTFMALSSLERIKWLAQHRPGLMARVPARLIASYLGIHKDVFSRLRSKL